jgi:opacity protein-like surface antigen
VTSMKMSRVVGGLVAMMACAALLAPSAAQATSPVHLTFDKSASGPGTWQGTVSGDVSGDLTTVLRDLRVTGDVWHVEFDWIVSAGSQSFTARLDGILNTETGAVVMNGRVIDGYLVGARVHEEGQLVDPGTLRFVGSIRIMPDSA